MLTGGVDANALQDRKIFGAARNIEEGGSLSIIATALVETGSQWMKLFLKNLKEQAACYFYRKLSDKRVFPSIDVTKSGTRKEEL